MRKCFLCLRRVRFYFKSKKQNKKWVYFIQNYCSQNSKFQWCELIMQNLDQIRKYTNPSQQTIRQLKSTNISSQIIKVMRRQYERRQTPFCLLVDIYTSYAIHKYMDGMSISQSLFKIQTDTQNYIDLLRSLMVVYYQLQERELVGDDQFFRVTLSNFITECLFLRQQFYNCIIQVTKISYKEVSDRIAFNMHKFQNLSIKEYDIHPKYTLDASTLQYFKKDASAQLQKPFVASSKIVKQVIKARTPLQKTKCVQNIIQQVQFSIRKFYQDNKIEQVVHLDADNAIAILIYILVQSEQSQFVNHINIIYHFLNKQLLEGKLRFCLDTMKACLQFMQKGNIKRNHGFNIQQTQFSLWINAKSYFQYLAQK